ncbi:MAG: FAD:protein FMN transferase [Clostridiales bacterium]|nr:FAD:protein FMN transferase [Clostridiales bacterium]
MRCLSKRIVSIFIIIIINCNLIACDANKKQRHEIEFFMLFDTVTQVVAYTETKEEFDNLSSIIYNSLKEYHELFDIYNNYENLNNLKTINDNAGIAAVKVNREIIDLLNFAKQEYENSDGLCNIALGSVLRIWHEYREYGIEFPESSSLPTMEELKFAAQHTDINNIIIDEKSSTVYLADAQMSLDVGAIAKGFATERVCQLAIKKGVTSALVSVGGNVRAIGSKYRNGEPWNVGIQNPNKEHSKKIIYTTLLDNKSLVTSGDYQRYYIVDGKRYGHVIDPKTLMPAENFKSVTIICEDSAKADSLSTIVYNMPFEEGFRYINDIPDTEAIWVLQDDTIKCSDNFEDYIMK